MTKFVVPIAGTIEAATVIWSTASAASTFTIMKNAAGAYTSGVIFTAAGGTAAITTGLTVNVVAGDIIEVRTNTLNFGPMTRTGGPLYDIEDDSAKSVNDFCPLYFYIIMPRAAAPKRLTPPVAGYGR